ncbi:MAG: LuxR C-terminal-related transcriptional regulator [Myxococcota bacterium]
MLSREALEALREALGVMARDATLASAAPALARVSALLPEGMGLTIDFRATETLGQPMVVLRPSRALPEVFAALTPRELEVAGLVAVGLRNRDIALALGIGVPTVKDHVHRILAKSGLDSRAAVAAVWREPG